MCVATRSDEKYKPWRVQSKDVREMTQRVPLRLLVYVPRKADEEEFEGQEMVFLGMVPLIVIARLEEPSSLPNSYPIIVGLRDDESLRDRARVFILLAREGRILAT